MIIVEGPDNAGKTTLIRDLIGMDPSLRLLTRQRVKPENGETIGSSYLQALIPPDNDWKGHAHGIVDRLLLSEIVYGNLYRGGHRITPLEDVLIRSLLRGYRALVVFCDPGDNAIMRSWLERDQDEGTSTFGGTNRPLEPLAIAKEYRSNIRSCFFGLSLITYDYTRPDALKQREEIIQSHNRQLWWLGC